MVFTSLHAKYLHAKENLDFSCDKQFFVHCGLDH